MDSASITAVTPLLTIATSVVVAVLSAYLTARFALRRFYSEKWWERRVQAYSAIIEATHHVREHADTNLTFYHLDVDMPREGEEKLEAEMRQAIAELRKQRDIGDFLLSTEALELIHQFFLALDHSTKTDTWLEHLQRKMEAIDSFLPAFRKQARADLKN